MPNTCPAQPVQMEGEHVRGEIGRVGDAPRRQSRGTRLCEQPEYIAAFVCASVANAHDDI